MQRSAVSLLTIFAAIVLAGQVYNFILLRSDIYVIYSVGLEKTELAPGEKPVLIYDFYRKRYCETKLLRVVRDVETNEAVYRIEEPGGLTPLGRAAPPGKTKLKNMPELPEGCYHIYTFVNSICTEGHHDMDFGPPVKFCVVPAR